MATNYIPWRSDIDVAQNNNPRHSHIPHPDAADGRPVLNGASSTSGTGQISWGPDTTRLGDLFLDTDQTNTFISLPALVTVDNTVGIYSCSLLTEISLPSLVTVGGYVYFNDDISLTALNVESLVTVVEDFDTSASSALATLNLPALVTVGEDFNAYDCTLLANLTCPVWVPTNGKVIDCHACALTATSIELILRRCVLAGVTTCTINLSGGSNAGAASLSVQGAADVVTLGPQLTINL